MLDDVSVSALRASFLRLHSPARSSSLTRRQTLLLPYAEDTSSPRSSREGLVRAVTSVKENHPRPVEPPTAHVPKRASSYHGRGKSARADDANNVREQTQESVADELAFADWYDHLEDQIVEASHDPYQSYLEELQSTEAYLQRVSSDTEQTLELLSGLRQAFAEVEDQTTTFQRQCEDLVKEQGRLEELADNVGDNLQYYSFLEPITRKLNAPGAGNFVRGREFSDMLARLDECLQYMLSHPSQRDAQTYGARYRQLLTRALTLIRGHFIAALKYISVDITKRIVDKQLNDTTMSTLLYAKFRVGAPELKQVAQEIYRRAAPVQGAPADSENEYQSLMSELYAAYSTTRGKLIAPIVSRRVSEIALSSASTSDLVAFARSSTGYVRGICADEHSLWKEWFDGEDGLYDYLEMVCEPLYDYLRPRIIHETQLVNLCELCTLFQTLYVKDQDDEAEPLEPGQLDFARLIQPALEDAQTRLVFRAQAILREDIEYYKPKAADLETSRRNSKAVALSGSRANGPAMSGRKDAQPETLPRDPVIVDEGDATDNQYGFDYQATSQGWYPTLRKAIWLLSRIYRLVNSTVFDDLAHNIVHQTTLSLHRAADALIPVKTKLDSQLFLLKHLLILKQQIVAFDIEYVTPDVSVDFSGMTSTFYELRERGALFDPRNLWRLLSGAANPSLLLPRVVENMLDAKVELDAHLRTVINDLCAASAGRITAVVSPEIQTQVDVDPAKVLPSIQGAATKEIPALRETLSIYLDDSRTRETLVGAIRDQVVLNYEAWHERWTTQRRRASTTGPRVVSSPDPSAESRRPSGGHRRGSGSTSKRNSQANGSVSLTAMSTSVWDPGTFAEWALGAFQVGRGYGPRRSASGSHTHSPSLGNGTPSRGTIGRSSSYGLAARSGGADAPPRPLRTVSGTSVNDDLASTGLHLAVGEREPETSASSRQSSLLMSPEPSPDSPLPSPDA